jgi:hypothetical protein
MVRSPSDKIAMAAIANDFGMLGRLAGPGGVTI